MDALSSLRDRHCDRRDRNQPVADAAFVIAALEEAGRTLMCLPHRGHSTHLRIGGLDYVHSAIEAYGYDRASLPRPAIPSGRAIDKMDETLAWIGLIPLERYVMRRVVGARALVNPVTERHLFTWRRIAHMVGASHVAVQSWHAQGIGHITAALSL